MLSKAKPLVVTEDGKKTLGRALKEYRERLGMSLRDAEALIKSRCGKPVSFNTISAIEKGYREADNKTLLLFVQAGYGGMSLSEMMDLMTDRRLSACEKSGSYRV